ncbi:NAD(P)-dependent oxidoreductase [Chloroflexota bacterium]
MTQKVGFVGLGEMGKPMAKRIVSNGYGLTVFDVMAGPVEELVAAGAKAAGTPREVAQASEVTITMVRDTPQSEAVIFGSDGVMEGAKQGSAIVIMSSVLPSFCQKVAQEASQKGVEVLDAAVSGARMGAEAGTLAIMAGGSKDVVEKYRALLETMGKITHCGDVGSGQVVKLANNIALYISLFASQEAVSFGTKNGVNEDVILEVLKQGTGNNWAIQNWQFANPTGRVGPVHWGIPEKDISMAMQVAREVNHPVPLTERVSQIVGELIKQSS